MNFHAGDENGFRAFAMSTGFVPNGFGLPERVSRQWLLDRKDHDELLGTIAIPVELQDGFVTHATYSVDCQCDDILGESCRCEEDDSIEWELAEYSG